MTQSILTQPGCVSLNRKQRRPDIGRLLKSMFTKCLGFFREHVHSCHQTPHDLTTCCLNWWWWWWWWWWGLIVKCVKLIDWRIRWFPSKPSTYAPPYSVNTKFWSEAAKKKTNHSHFQSIISVILEKIISFSSLKSIGSGFLKRPPLLILTSQVSAAKNKNKDDKRLNQVENDGDACTDTLPIIWQSSKLKLIWNLKADNSRINLL